MLLIDLLILLTVIGVVVLGVKFVQNAAPRRALRETKRREAIGTAALRSIANGAASPALEAQIALDDIERSYYKELS